MHKNLIVNALGFMLIALAVSACGTKDRPIEISTSPVEKPSLVLPQPDRIISRPVEWIVVTPENYEEVINRLKNNKQGVALFALTADGYENVALNLNDIRTYIQQQQAIILAYERYYQESNAAIDLANSQLSQ